MRSIEHGDLIGPTAARAIKDSGAYLVPTRVTYEVIWREGKRYGIGDHQIHKINQAREQSFQGLTHAYQAGCKIGSGSDLLVVATNPLQHLRVFQRPDALRVIMKGGRFYRRGV